MISIERAKARIVAGSFASPVPLSPTTKPRPRSTFSSCPFTRHMLRSVVRPKAVGPEIVTIPSTINKQVFILFFNTATLQINY